MTLASKTSELANQASEIESLKSDKSTSANPIFSTESTHDNSMIECKFCHEMNNANAKYCKYCNRKIDNSQYNSQRNGTQKKQIEENENTWVCPKCKNVNMNYVGTCGCGEKRTK